MRAIRWSLAAAGTFAVLAAVWYLGKHLLHLDDGATWAIAGTASAVALAVLTWWASRDVPVGDSHDSKTAIASSDGTQQLIPTAAGGPAVVGDVPIQPDDFQARDNLLNMLCGQDDGSGTCAVQAVIGMPGVGKTQVVAAYARQRSVEQWRLIGWVNAEDPSQMLNGLADIAARLGIGRQDEDLVRRAKEVRHWLEEDGQRCLVVFDNAIDPDQLRPYLPVVGSAHIIITSTRHSMARLGTSLPVAGFTERQALAYLRRRTGHDDDDGAQELAAELGHLPLALAQAAAMIKNQQIPYAVLLERLRQLPVAEYLARSEGDPYPRSVAATILLALQAAEAGRPHRAHLLSHGLARVAIADWSLAHPPIQGR